MASPIVRFDAPTINLVIDGLPALTGSEKQIAWAEDIRRNMFDTQIRQPFDRCRAEAVRQGKEHQIEPAAAKMSAVLAPALGETSAKWWIDNRDGNLQLLARGWA